jgi:hypothetical protein
MKYTLEIEMPGNKKNCFDCPCLHYEPEYEFSGGGGYCAGQYKESDYPECLKTCPLKEVAE